MEKNIQTTNVTEKKLKMSKEHEKIVRQIIKTIKKYREQLHLSKYDKSLYICIEENLDSTNLDISYYIKDKNGVLTDEIMLKNDFLRGQKALQNSNQLFRDMEYYKKEIAQEINAVVCRSIFNIEKDNNFIEFYFSNHFSKSKK